jgi:hypothetical protein
MAGASRPEARMAVGFRLVGPRKGVVRCPAEAPTAIRRPAVVHIPCRRC